MNCRNDDEALARISRDVARQLAAANKPAINWRKELLYWALALLLTAMTVLGGSTLAELLA